MELILASKSKRRKELLEKEGYKFVVFVPKKDEKSIIGKEYNIELVKNCAIEKLNNAYEELREKFIREHGIEHIKGFNPLIVACDTVVVNDNKIIGKPKDRDDAVKILKSLSGKTHQVVSAIAVIKEGKRMVDYEISRVTFKNISDSDIEQYVDRMKPYDKAGSYGIQDEGFDFVESVDGNIDNVIGLPIATLHKLLNDK